MTLAVAHREKDVAVLDLVRERKPPFSPEVVVKEFADLLRQYRVYQVTGDRYGGQWVQQAFQKVSITYTPSEKVKSELYGALLPAINSGKVELLDLPKLRAQLCQLERRTARGGRESVDHPPGGHDDVANAAAGCLTHVGLARRAEVRVGSFVAGYDGGVTFTFDDAPRACSCYGCRHQTGCCANDQP